MRWSQGVWSENRLIDAINSTADFFSIPYGPSGTAPTENVRAYELYFEKLEAAGLGDIKRPDLLIFRKNEEAFVKNFLSSLPDIKLDEEGKFTVQGSQSLPFILEKDLKELVEKSIVAIECENSLWIAEKMPDFGKPLKPYKRLGGKLGLSTTAKVPNVIIKEEDRAPLKGWQELNNKPIHIWHVFYDRAAGLAFDEAERLIQDGLTLPKELTYQAPGGATTNKVAYFHYYHYAYPLGVSKTQPALIADAIIDKNGHILPYVKFEGGSLEITQEALKLLNSL